MFKKKKTAFFSLTGPRDKKQFATALELIPGDHATAHRLKKPVAQPKSSQESIKIIGIYQPYQYICWLIPES